MKPYLGAAALALVAAGLATVIVQAIAPVEDRASAPSLRPTASLAPQPETPKPEIPATAPASPVETAPPPARVEAPAPVVAPALPAPANEPPPAPVAPPVMSPPSVTALAPPPTAPPPTPPTEAAPAAVGAVTTGALKLSTDELVTVLERGEAKLKVGDVAAARRYFERAALAGDARGATAMGRTYDPEVLSRLPVIGLEPNAAEAASWYDKARTLKAGP